MKSSANSINFSRKLTLLKRKIHKAPYTQLLIRHGASKVMTVENRSAITLILHSVAKVTMSPRRGAMPVSVGRSHAATETLRNFRGRQLVFITLRVVRESCLGGGRQPPEAQAASGGLKPVFAGDRLKFLGREY